MEDTAALIATWVLGLAGLSVSWYLGRRSGRTGAELRLTYRGAARWEDNFLKLSLTNRGDTIARAISLQFPHSAQTFKFSPPELDDLLPGESVDFEVYPHSVEVYGSLIAGDKKQRTGVVSYRDHHLLRRTRTVLLPGLSALIATINHTR